MEELLLDIENNDKELIIDAIEHLKIKFVSINKFAEGTNSSVYLLNEKYTLKIHNDIKIKAEYEFCIRNKNNYFQNMIYCQNENKYIVYKYIDGVTQKGIFNLENIMYEIKDIIDNYHNYENEGFGYLYEECDTWENFLKKQIDFHKTRIKELIDEVDILNQAIDTLSKYPFEKKLLHGDLGIHNFIIRKNKIVGIIDPEPIIGDKIYDYIFAIFSNINIIKNINIGRVFEILNEPREKVKAMILIVLYMNISRCIKYHVNDLDFYLELWYEFIEL